MTTPASIRGALAGVRAFILDADGVLVLKGAAIPGAIEAVARLTAAGIPYRVVTNFSMAHRTTLAEHFGRTGAAIDPERIVTAASAAAAYTATEYPDGRIYVLAQPDALREWDGQSVVTPAEARAPGATATAVVIGDAGSELSFGNLDAAFRLVRGGAAFLAMHRNPWWLTPAGVTLDSGAAVAGLEFALGRRALVLGKPSPVVFRQALRALASDLGERRLPGRAAAMVGDDLRADLAPARRLGLRTALVLTGKLGAVDVAASVERARFAPDVVAGSLGSLVEAFLARPAGTTAR